MQVRFKDPGTGKLKDVKVGWSWTLFMYSSFFGLPLFLRKLHFWGLVFLALSIIDLLAPSVVDTDTPIYAGLMFFIFPLPAVWIGLMGNEMTAKTLLERGWLLVDPQSDAARQACRKWGLVPRGPVAGWPPS
jgi:hypothetical protein